MKKENYHQKKPFDRYLSSLDVWALSLGCIIGWGAFVMPGTTFLPNAGPVGTVIAMFISTVITLVIGHNYFSLMKRYPGIGGVYTYNKAVFGKDHAFLSSWFLCLAYVSLIPQNVTVLALICRILTGDRLLQSVRYHVAGTDVLLSEILISIGVLVLIGILAICLKPFLQWVQTALGIILAAGILVICIMVISRIRITDLTASFGTVNDLPFSGVFSIVILAPWAFVGFEVVSLETAHFHFSVKKSGRLITLAILMGGVIYSVLALTAIARQPETFSDWQTYMAGLDSMQGISSVPTFYVLKSMFGIPGITIIAITAFAAVVSSIIGFYRASARILMNMAQDHILGPAFNRPSVCFLFLMGISAVIVLFGRKALSWVVDLSSFGAIIGFGYVSGAVYITARKEGSGKQKIPGIIGIILAAGFGVVQLIPGLSSIETMEAESYLLLALWCLLGFLFYWRTMSVGDENRQRNESVTIAILFFLLILSAVIWYSKKMTSLQQEGISGNHATLYSIVLIVLILLGLVVMLRIHAQLKKRRMLLETENIRALESSQAKSQFLFNMSHDLRTPMNAIMGYSELGLKETDPASMQNYLRKINQSGQQMLALINDILEMSRIESGVLELDEKPLDIVQAFQEMEVIFSGQMQEKHIRFQVECADVVRKYVYCDRKNLSKVLMNILSNAYKFTPEGGEVTASMREVEAAQDGRATYEILVKDTGIGMSDEFAAKMFEAFERERTSTDSGLEGTGLGLAITKNILDQMGASISVHTAQGQGTEIRIVASFRIADEAAQEELSKAEENVAEDVSSVAQEDELDFHNVRLLLVEDNMINLEIAVMILTQAGFQLETAENGQEAVDKIKAVDPGYYDAVLMDIQMPVMDGYTATRTIRALEDPEKAAIPVIAMTANAFKEDEQQAFQAGMQAHIAKPLDVEVMLSTIKRILI